MAARSSELRPSERIPLGSRPLGSRRQTACKPGSVPRKPGGWPFIWDSRRRLPRATHPDGGAETRLDAPGVNRALSAPSLFGLAPGEACHAAPVASRAVRSYRTLSPLPGPMPGGLLSVALSRGSPPPGVTRHRISVEPGLSSPGRVSPLAGRGHPARLALSTSLPDRLRSRRSAYAAAATAAASAAVCGSASPVTEAGRKRLWKRREDSRARPRVIGCPGVSPPGRPAIPDALQVPADRTFGRLPVPPSSLARTVFASGQKPTPAAASIGQSNSSPGSLLRSGATSLWPTTRSGADAVARHDRFRQGHHGLHLQFGKRPVSELVTGVDDLDADGDPVHVGFALPAGDPGVPGPSGLPLHGRRRRRPRRPCSGR